MLLERVTQSVGGLEHRGMQLCRPFLQRAEHILQPLAGRFELELPQPLFDGGLAQSFFVFGLELQANTLLLDPKVLLDDVLLSLLAALLESMLCLDHIQPTALLGRLALLAEHLAAELHDAYAVAQRQALPQ